MHWRRKRTWLAIIAALGLAAGMACSALPTAPNGPTLSIADLAGWSEATHSNKAEPNYALVFPTNQVKEFHILIDPADWQAMLDDMTRLHGPRGSGGGPGGFGNRGPGAPVAGSDGRAIGFPARPSDATARPDRMPGLGGPFGSSEKPMWVAATIAADGRKWEHVGVRFKGNSSLNTAWRSGTDRMPFKLDFDQFEDEYPDIKNQRFHGFKQLSLSTNMGDSTHIRETLAYDLLEESGLPAANTGFYNVYLDYGKGSINLGVYTAVEVIDDTVVKRVFGGDDGNIYEAEGPAVSLAKGTRSQIRDSFQKENNKKSDWSDIERLYDVLHADQRTSDPAAWRANLEAVFDVPNFLRWLAVSAVLQHWDTYGGMAHNFYLYNNPANNRLTWISWDHNLILGASPGGPGGPGGGMAPPPGMPPGAGAFPPPPDGAFPPPGGAWGGPPPDGAFPLPPGGGGRGGMGGMGRGSTLDKRDVGENWPLIRYLLDDPTYYAAYVQYLRETVDGPFAADKVQGYAAVLSPYAAKQSDGGNFASAVQSLIQTAQSRVQAVRDFLAGHSN